MLSAGYHSVVGFFRDDTPLMQLILDDKSKKEIDRLWNEFDFIANFTARTWTQYFFNQSGEVRGTGAESASPRPVGHAITDEPVILAMRDEYLAKALAEPSNDAVAPLAIRDHFDRINATLRGLEKEHAAAQPKHLESLLSFAAHAYRRPLTSAERADLLAYYQTLRAKNELSHEDALREVDREHSGFAGLPVSHRLARCEPDNETEQPQADASRVGDQSRHRGSPIIRSPAV